MTIDSRCIRIVTVLTALLMGSGCGAGDPEAQTAAEQPTPTLLGEEDVITAQRTDVSAGTTLIGSLDPYQVVDVKAQVPGTIADLRVDRGEPVKRGELLARIQAAGIRSEAASAKAQLAAARQRLEGARKLYEAGAMSEVEYRTTVAEYEAAEGQFASAQEAAQRTNVTAPITGIVSQRPVNEGEAVSAGQELLTIVNSEVLELTGQVPVQAASRVEVGQPVRFTLDAYPGRVFEGTIARIDPVADPATRRVQVTVRLPNPQGRLVGGQFVTGRIVSSNAPPAIVLPPSALRGSPGSQYVFVVDEGVIKRQPVTLGEALLDSDRVVIASGLREGQQVIVSPATDIEAGAPVRLSNAESAGAAQ